MPVRCSGWKRVTFLAVILACSHVQHAYSRLGGLVFMGDESRFQQQSLIDPWIEVSLCSIYIHPLCWQMCKYCLCCILENLFWEVFMVESSVASIFAMDGGRLKWGQATWGYIYMPQRKNDPNIQILAPSLFVESVNQTELYLLHLWCFKC